MWAAWVVVILLCCGFNYYKKIFYQTIDFGIAVTMNRTRFNNSAIKNDVYNYALLHLHLDLGHLAEAFIHSDQK